MMENLKTTVSKLKEFCEKETTLDNGDIVFVARSQNPSKLLIVYNNGKRLGFDHISRESNRFYADYADMLEKTGESYITHPLMKTAAA